MSIQGLIRSMKGLAGNSGNSYDIPIIDGNGYALGTLRPIDISLAADTEVISKLVKWRKMFRKYFLTQFLPTVDNASTWLQTTVLPSDDRILFLIYDLNGAALGNFGVCDLFSGEPELDNLIRGEKGGDPKLIYHAEVAILTWLFQGLGFTSAKLHVFSNNYRTMSLHKSIGFCESARYNLVKRPIEGGLRYETSAESPDGEDGADFTLVKMTLGADDFIARFCTT